MKTTFDLDDDLVTDAKVLAAVPTSRAIALPVFKGRGGLVDGIDPLSNKALLKALGNDA